MKTWLWRLSDLVKGEEEGRKEDHLVLLPFMSYLRWGNKEQERKRERGRLKEKEWRSSLHLSKEKKRKKEKEEHHETEYPLNLAGLTKHSEDFSLGDLILMLLLQDALMTSVYWWRLIVELLFFPKQRGKCIACAVLSLIPLLSWDVFSASKRNGLWILNTKRQ